MDWNVVVTVESEAYREAIRLLTQFGQVRRTDFYNVLVLMVDDPRAFLDAFADLVAREPGTRNAVSHVTPADAAFHFTDAAQFEGKARDIALGWAPRITGKSFHVRMHRRGFKGTLSTPEEERFLDDALLAATAATGSPARISFDDPDVIISVQTVGDRAGLSLWTRDDFAHYPFLDVD